ncbi:suppressor APC domain-containing protein 2 [Erpetoichthys calabaricus]|uniref:Suppressor APC domain containing 2 n=1 Tax=Erpetoichthys calabaricus TaxID=27687 RepID=A0A8C4SU51_ERPCA|nr:suppressor APC domain-containing protein 2 [Erpetoichthys calabaricus]
MALLVPDRRCALSMQPREAEFSTDGLPKAFLQSMRTLFDILDDRRRGYVHISEIESRWQGTDTRELPRGVLECLRRVAPAHGCLSFERFVAGLRSSLLHPENGRSGAACTANRSRVPGLARTKHPSETEEPADSRKTGLRCSSGYEKTGRATGGRVRSIESLALESGPPGAAPMPRSQSEVSTGLGDSRRHGRGRDEQRRHTISNGVDYSLLKRMKELEQEKDSLLQGVEVVERARDWYHQQIQAVQERQKLVGQDSGGTDLFSEACQGRLNQLLPKLQEVNRCINELLSSSGKPFTTSAVPNPPQSTVGLANSQQAVHMLKEQNRLLTKEVTDKSERITQLEQEKSALIKQLFEARARSNPETSAMDSTFI